MATGTVIAGRGSLKLDSVIYNCTSIKVNLGGEKREKMKGMGGIAGDKVETVAPRVEATIIVTPDVNVTALNALVNIVADVQFADGRACTINGASVSEPVTHSAEDGTCDVALEGLGATEA